MKKEEKKKLPISFYSKEVKICPICGEKFYKEEIRVSHWNIFWDTHGFTVFVLT